MLDRQPRLADPSQAVKSLVLDDRRPSVGFQALGQLPQLLVPAFQKIAERRVGQVVEGRRADPVLADEDGGGPAGAYDLLGLILPVPARDQVLDIQPA